MGARKMNATETSPKIRMIDIIQSQPDDSSYDEILRELAFARMIELGLADSDAGRTVSSEEVKRRMRSWQK
jgi:predicted transcriptional regulator